MKKICKVILLSTALALLVGLTACGGTPLANTSAPDAVPAVEPAGPGAAGEGVEPLAETTVCIDIAASLEAVFRDVIIPAYEERQPNVTIRYNTGSSGALLAQIEEANGVGHDLFFSAGKSQVTTLEESDGLVVEGSVVNLLSNQLCLVRGSATETAVTGWDNLADANSMALCGGSVPVGKYSRIALVSLGYLAETEDPAAYTAAEISAALNGLEIDEADDVELAAAKAAEGSVEIATIYYSDYYNHQTDLTIIAQDDGALTGAIVYPVCQVANPAADEAERTAAADFLAFLQTEVCLDAYETYCFIVNG